MKPSQYLLFAVASWALGLVMTTGCGGKGGNTSVTPEVTRAFPATLNVRADYIGKPKIAILGKGLKANEPIYAEIIGSDGEVRERLSYGVGMFIYADSLSITVPWTAFVPPSTRGDLQIHVYAKGKEVKGSPVAFTVTEYTATD
jgi:hypothetical protein